MDILALNPQISPKNERKKKWKAYLKMIASNKIDQNSAKHLSSSLPLFLENVVFSLACFSRISPPSSQRFTSLQLCRLPFPAPASQKHAQNLLQTARKNLLLCNLKLLCSPSLVLPRSSSLPENSNQKHHSHNLQLACYSSTEMHSSRKIPPRCQPFIGSFNSTTWFIESQLRGDTWFLEIVTPVQT